MQHWFPLFGGWPAQIANCRINMAEEWNLENIIRSIPSHLDEAHRNLHSDNTNVLEFVRRRLEDSIHVLNVLVYRSSSLHINECENLLRYLLSELQEMHARYDEITSQSRVHNDDHFRCPRENVVRGRPRYSLSNDLITGLHRIHRNWQQVAADT